MHTPTSQMRRPFWMSSSLIVVSSQTTKYASSGRRPTRAPWPSPLAPSTSSPCRNWFGWSCSSQPSSARGPRCRGSSRTTSARSSTLPSACSICSSRPSSSRSTHRPFMRDTPMRRTAQSGSVRRHERRRPHDARVKDTRLSETSCADSRAARSSAPRVPRGWLRALLAAEHSEHGLPHAPHAAADHELALAGRRRAVDEVRGRRAGWKP